MTNTLALWLAALILGLIVLDYTVYDLQAGLFLARKGLDLIQYLAFWR